MASPDKLSRPRHTGANWEGEGLLLGRPRRESLSPLASWLIGGAVPFRHRGAESRFQEVMARLGIEVQYTSRPQTKGKVERDSLGVQRNRVRDLDDLNARAETWRRWYNHREHEGIGKECPASRYYHSPHHVEAEALWDAFAREVTNGLAPMTSYLTSGRFMLRCRRDHSSGEGGGLSGWHYQPLGQEIPCPQGVC